ncbi:hypothetical protein ABZ628_28570 [Streptomyces diastaticus]|uniref:hypothetical protein n=1 Tax=Streptomyces diastaticus TaxID=1956 RepID=UPI0033F9040F
MSGTKTFTTQFGTYAYSVSEGENGETVYDLSRVFQDGALPVGAIVIHPDYNPFPTVEGLLNVQFGKGGEDRNERTDVPMLGEELEAAFIIGHQLVDPTDLDTDPDAESEGKAKAEPKVRFLRGYLRAAATETNSPSTEAGRDTFLAVQDIVTELVKLYRADKNTPKRAAKYTTQVLAPQRAELLAPQIKETDDMIAALQLKKARLIEKLNGTTAA